MPAFPRDVEESLYYTTLDIDTGMTACRWYARGDGLSLVLPLTAAQGG